MDNEWRWTGPVAIQDNNSLSPPTTHVIPTPELQLRSCTPCSSKPTPSSSQPEVLLLSTSAAPVNDDTPGHTLIRRKARTAITGRRKRSLIAVVHRVVAGAASLPSCIPGSSKRTRSPTLYVCTAEPCASTSAHIHICSRAGHSGRCCVVVHVQVSLSVCSPIFALLRSHDSNATRTRDPHPNSLKSISVGYPG